ncbi:MAG: hypothetical protein K9G49_05570 [Taibaiella sp.]|nr:hypothetical protein [Taibaiella sp.]
MQNESNIKSKLLVIFFLVIIMLPACYAIFKEYKYRQQEKGKTTPVTTSHK